MLKIYKQGQGHTIRVIMAASVGFMLLFGCYELYFWLDWSDPAETPVLYKMFSADLFPLPGLDLRVTGRLILSVGLFAAGALAIWWSSNFPKAADFLVETEGEMRKVSWPARNEVIDSSIVVIFTVVILGLFILGADLLLGWVQGQARVLLGGL